MTQIYFVRHAQPVRNWAHDRTRPLSEEGMEDSKKVVEVLKEIRLDYAISSPYIRSMDTIRECVRAHGLEIATDERLRERVGGTNVIVNDMIQRRWSDFEFHEEGGESLGMVQRRNIEAIRELLYNHEAEKIILGTHGTALSTILNYYDPSFNCEGFFRIFDYMPYIIRLDFEGTKCIGKEELLIIEKKFYKI